MNSIAPPLEGLRCPNCKSRLKMNVRETGSPLCDREYIHEYKCPKCNYIFERRRKTPPFEISVKKMLARVSGDIGENIAFKVLIDKGFEIISFQDLLSELGDDYRTFRHSSYSEEYLGKFLDKKHLRNFIAFCRAWTEDPNTPSGKILKQDDRTFRSSHFGPDWIGKKDGVFSLIEVKTNKAVLQKYQKKMMLRAKEFGFTPLVIKIKVEVKVPLKKVEVKRL